jgi:hypothetical protein
VAEASTPRPERGPGGEQRGGAQRTGGRGSPVSADAGFDRLLDELRGEVASAQRRRETWLRRQAADDATVAGTLVSLAERGAILAVSTCAGNRYVGPVRGAGTDLVLMDVRGGCVAIEVGAIEHVSAQGDDLVEGRRLRPVGHRRGADTTTLVEVLALAVAERPDVTLVARSGLRHTGELMAVGADVVMLRPADGGPMAYAPVASLSEVVLPASTGSG